MENKINLVEILKNCPKGMELDCTIWNGVTFEGIGSSTSYPIEIKIGAVTDSLTEFGEWNSNENSKCVIFPKDKTTWEGFVPPHEFKDGDIIYTLLEGNLEFISIFKKTTGALVYCYVDLGTQLYVESMRGLCKKNDIKSQRLATEDEKQRLFDAIKNNGYKWNAENKTLEKLIEPKFKVGDRVRHKDDKTVITITGIKDDYYFMQFYYPKRRDYQKDKVSFKYQDEYELAPNKFDISTLKPFESKVLVRGTDQSIWKPAIYGFSHGEWHYAVGGTGWAQCIPYEGNEHLLGTSNDCSEFYKTWK